MFPAWPIALTPAKELVLGSVGPSRRVLLLSALNEWVRALAVDGLQECSWMRESVAVLLASPSAWVARLVTFLDSRRRPLEVSHGGIWAARSRLAGCSGVGNKGTY